MPLRILNFKSPLEVLQDTNSYIVPPDVFSCVCFVHKRNIGKLYPRALKCVFVGYFATQKGYKCYYPPSRKFFVSMEVTFWELDPYFSPSQSPLQGEIKEQEVTTLGQYTPINILNPISCGEDEKGKSGRLDRLDLKAYIHRDKTNKATSKLSSCGNLWWAFFHSWLF